ncbi:hypothetical protein [Photobacterium halotolerans]|uniref:hypothetical protein n=1 Tax=Photobacterium halotolerans TaxID=265726 RepID=UPI0013724E92|nr:hypothetical protein [Photobacterium halotolerans]NAW87507.1 hypothetical protein [Photobacterium halotolerans]
MQQNKSMMPWDLEPAFCKSDIDIVMEKLSKACFDLKDSINKKYDDNWTIGTKKYGWALNVISQMALSKKYPFITIGKSGLGQVFKINGIPVALVTDDAVKLKKQHRYMPSDLEQKQLPLFTEPALPICPLWRLILDLKVSANSLDELESSPQLILIGLDGSKVVACYNYDEVFVPTVVPAELMVRPSEVVEVVLPEESKAKAVKLVRRVKSNDEKKSEGQ